MVSVNAECCDEPSEDCSTGQPASCNVGCASVLLPFFADCSEALGKHASDYSSVVALCRVALDGTGRRLLMTPAAVPIYSAAGAAPNQAESQNAVDRTIAATGAAVADVPTRGRRRAQQDYDALIQELEMVRAALAKKSELLTHRDEQLSSALSRVAELEGIIN